MSKITTIHDLPKRSGKNVSNNSGTNTITLTTTQVDLQEALKKKHEKLKMEHTMFVNEKNKRIFAEGECSKLVKENEFLKEEVKDLSVYKQAVEENNKKIDAQVKELMNDENEDDLILPDYLEPIDDYKKSFYENIKNKYNNK